MTPDPTRPLGGPLNGYTVTVSAQLAGSKRAVRSGPVLFVSPAMWEMIRTADGEDELAFIMEHITVVDVPYTPPGYFTPVYAPLFALGQAGPRA